MASASTYFGGSANVASRSCTERSFPTCGASVRCHQSILAVSNAAASQTALVRGRPDTAATPAAWRSRSRAQRRPHPSSISSKSPKGKSADRDPNVSLTVFAFTAAALASPGRRTANRSDARPDLFASTTMSEVEALPSKFGSASRENSDLAVNATAAQFSRTDRQSEVLATNAFSTNAGPAREQRHRRTMAAIQSSLLAGQVFHQASPRLNGKPLCLS